MSIQFFYFFVLKIFQHCFGFFGATVRIPGVWEKAGKFEFHILSGAENNKIFCQITTSQNDSDTNWQEFGRQSVANSQPLTEVIN